MPAALRLCLVLLTLLPAALPAALPAEVLAQRAQPITTERAVDAVLDDPAFRNAFWGVYAVDLASGAVLYERNVGRSFVPASNAKLYTTAAALDLLGPAYTYRTLLLADGPVRNGTLEGNLVVRGAGDPSIGGRMLDGDRLRVFRAWADSLKALGITRVTGALIGDDDRFADEPLGYGWSWDDLTYWYGAEIGTLTFNDNAIDLVIEPRRPGMTGTVRWEPFNTDYVTIVNRTTTTASGSIREGYERLPGTNTIVLRSRVPVGRPDEESLAVTNPTLFFAHVLRQTLRQAGIEVEGPAVDVDQLPEKPRPEALRPLASYTSPPLAQIVEVINKKSINLYAELLLRTMAAESLGDPGEVTGEDGLEVVKQFLAKAQADTSLYRLTDGSGLSRYSLVTPQQTMALLRYMWNHRDAAVRKAFLDSLPLGGVDGTLQNRFGSGPAARNVRAKTGTLSNVSSLSGYVTTTDGRPIAFVLMSNHHTVPTRRVTQAQEAIVNALAAGGAVGGR